MSMINITHEEFERYLEQGETIDSLLKACKMVMDFEHSRIPNSWIEVKDKMKQAINKAEGN